MAIYEHSDRFTTSATTAGSSKLVPLDTLRPWPENPRRITPERLDDLKRNLAADPDMLWARPLQALEDGTVIAGSHRLAAALALGWTEIPVIYVDLDTAGARLRALRDNSSFADWDEPRLADLLSDLAADEIDLALTGLDSHELDRLLAGIPTVLDPDEAPRLPIGPANSVPGEIYELGRHRLACGNARDPEVVRRLFGDERTEVVWTDPPYGVGYSGRTAAALTIDNDDPSAAALLEAVLRTTEPLLAPCARFYICCPALRQGTEFRLVLDRLGWRLHQTLAWVKNSPVLGHCDHHLQHEEILYGWAPGPGRPGRGRHVGSCWYGDNAQSSIFFVERPTRSESHPTMKPVALIERQLMNSSARDATVYDPFAGSGSTLIACERTGRRCLAVEIDPRYCDVVRARFEEQSRDR